MGMCRQLGSVSAQLVLEKKINRTVNRQNNNQGIQQNRTADFSMDIGFIYFTRGSNIKPYSLLVLNIFIADYNTGICFSSVIPCCD